MLDLVDILHVLNKYRESAEKQRESEYCRGFAEAVQLVMEMASTGHNEGLVEEFRRMFRE